MSDLNDARARLDALLTSIENSILETDDSELVEERSSTVVRQCRKLIDSHLSRGFNADILTVARGDALKRRRLLTDLLAARRTLPSYMRLAFSAGRQPSDDEIEQMIDHLLRLGILDKKEDD